jgi:hypothetical protein
MSFTSEDQLENTWTGLSGPHAAARVEVAAGSMQQLVQSAAECCHEQALPSHGANQPFRVAILPRRTRRDRSVANAHGA